MAWDVAAYAVALAVLLAAGVFAAGMYRLSRSLRRWDRMAVHLVRRAESALDETVRLAEEGRETVEMWRTTMGGFARLAEGARAVGDAAEAAAQTAAHVVSFWRERAFGQRVEDDSEPGVSPYWAEFGRNLGRVLRRKFSAAEDEDPTASVPQTATSADHNEGE